MRTRILVPLAAVCAAAAALGAVALASGKTSSDAHSAQIPGAKKALFAVLTGRKELDEQGNPGAGAPGARGSFTAIIDGTQICYGLTVKNLAPAPVAAHIHKGAATKSGNVVVPLTQPSGGDPGAASDCVAEPRPGLFAAILRDPDKYYVNVHTASFPAGAVRGQLFGKRR